MLKCVRRYCREDRSAIRKRSIRTTYHVGFKIMGSLAFVAAHDTEKMARNYGNMDGCRASRNNSQDQHGGMFERRCVAPM